MADTVEASAALPPDPASPRNARRLLRDVLERCGRPEWGDAAELALGELATNAVLHTRADFVVRVHCTPDELRVEVEDTSPVIPAQRGYGAEASTGRGLALVTAVSHDHGVTATGHGKIVWFSLRDAPLSTVDASSDALLDTWGDADGEPHVQDSAHGSVTLAGFPPTLWLAAVEVHDALLRELSLVRAGHSQEPADLAAADRARFAIRSALDRALADDRAQAAARSPLPPGHPAQLPPVPPVLDLVVPLWPTAAEDAAALQDVVDEANRLSRHGQLLTPPSLSEVTALRDWAAEQIIIGATSGRACVPWAGVDAGHLAQDPDTPVQQVDYDAQQAVGGPRTAIVIDRANRILAITASLAAVIGWEADDLVGRRVLAIVPPAYREAHLAGFSRHLSTGQAHALRRDLQLPVLCANGSEILCDFWIDADRSRSGLPVYIAFVSPATGPNGSS